MQLRKKTITLIHDKIIINKMVLSQNFWMPQNFLFDSALRISLRIICFRIDVY